MIEVRCIKEKGKTECWGVSVIRDRNEKVAENYFFEGFDAGTFGWITCYEIGKNKSCFTILKYDILRVFV